MQSIYAHNANQRETQTWMKSRGRGIGMAAAIGGLQKA